MNVCRKLPLVQVKTAPHIWGPSCRKHPSSSNIVESPPWVVVLPWECRDPTLRLEVTDRVVIPALGVTDSAEDSSFICF